MILLVDVGNTRIKWGLLHGQAISGHGALLHAGRPINDVLAQAWANLPRPARILAANVAGMAMAENLDHYCREHFQMAPEYVIAADRACGVTNGYTQPAQLGADRWAAVIGAYNRHGGAACIIGCGTAITVDTVTHEGQHLGGLIAPGIGVMHKALASAAAAIPAEQGDTLTLYAHDTRTAVTSGILYAAAGFIERTLREIHAQHGARMPVLLSGGDAAHLQAVIRAPVTLAPHLVLEGLSVLAGQQA